MIKDFYPHMSSRPRPTQAGRRRADRGQSLLEFALTLPILLLIVAGTVEVTNMLTIYNEVTLAAREGARHAAQGGPDSGVRDVIKNSLINTPVRVDPNLLNAWIVRPQIDTTASWYWKGGANNKDTWGSATEKCIYPASTDVPNTCGAWGNPIAPRKVGDDLTRVSGDALDEERMVVVVVRYEAQTLLNLNLGVFGVGLNTVNGRFPMYAYVVMRQEVSSLAANQVSGGCSLYPIAINSAKIPPTASEGYLFELAINTLGTRDSFGFLAWRAAYYNNESRLTASSPSGSLAYPGNSQSGIPSGNTLYYYQNPFDITDTQVRRGSWVAANQTLLTSGVLTDLEAHRATNSRALRVIIYDFDKPVATPAKTPVPTAQNPGQAATASDGTRWLYQVKDFVVVRIDGTWNTPNCTTSSCDPKTKKTTASNMIRFELVNRDTSCGYPQ